MNDEQPLRLSFGPVAEAYDRGRPEYSEETADWLAGTDPLDVLELGAGTGKLTARLVALGHRVHATDPDEGMLDVLARNVPQARTATASAEELPFADKSFDVVVVAQAFHWFDHGRALPEIARVLRPTGRIALVWHVRDTRIPWARKLGTVLGGHDSEASIEAEVEPLIASRYFGVVAEASFKTWQHLNTETLRDLALSRSNIASLGAQQREARIREVLDFYDGYGRGMDGMELPYLARCWSASVIERAQPVTPPVAGPSTELDDASDPAPKSADVPEDTQAFVPDGMNPVNAETDTEADQTAARAKRSQEIFLSDGTDTDMLLIDFR